MAREMQTCVLSKRLEINQKVVFHLLRKSLEKFMQENLVFVDLSRHEFLLISHN